VFPGVATISRVGKVFEIGSRAISLQVGAYDYVQRLQGTPEYVIRAQIQFMFPRTR